MKNPFRYFKTSPEVIRLAVMMYIRFPLSLRQVEDLSVANSYSRGDREFEKACRAQKLSLGHFP